MEMSDEDWFYESVSRYKTLNMFELEQPVQQVEPLGNYSIVVGSSNNNRHQLLELSLPSSLVPQTSENVITNDTDLKIKCGTFTEAKCFQIKTITERKVVVSHENTKNVALYSLSSDSDEITKESLKIGCDITCPMIATNGSLLCLAKKRADQIYLYDMNNEKRIHSFKIDEKYTPFECDERIVPMFIGPDVVALGRQITGGIFFCDHRMPSGWSLESFYEENCTDRGFWAFTSLYECSGKQTTNQSMSYAKVCKTGSLVMYDSRNIKRPGYFDKNLGLKTADDTPLQIRFKPGNSDYISISGFDEKVYVYQVLRGEDPRLIFTHDGHKHVEGYSSQTMVTSHVWSQLDNLVISSADNGTFQMWQFEN